MTILRALLALLLSVLPATAEQIVLGLSEYRVSITADFDGSEILVYGAVKRQEPIPAGPPLQVVVTVEGPSTPLTVWRKDRRWGIWVNSAAVTIDRAPSFYAIATTGPLREVLSETEDLRHRISITRVIRAVGIAAQADDSPAFVNALQRIRIQEKRFVLKERSVALSDQTLFRTDIELPAALTEGDYRVRVFLTRDGRVLDKLERSIFVRKEGLERFFFRLAHDQPLVYGLLSLFVAVVAGWLASAAFRLLRN
ncbi:hypothetical protein E7811_04090 [Aliigemmobacter aestuarii]|uniref:TIGR02186 family protein n=1 Tax=Aliigemmobacter aestuarii TaxID=1445661 RepID=A0A4S3MTS8_9RHOB|nr:TIGR02186 family protein [Gemmobacter aestuarii]THD84911.1 hypothetical protein E7811_04090 [Gemmobacter aestuarii]